jgi:hypothetical protein
MSKRSEGMAPLRSRRVPLREKLALVTGVIAFGNGQCARYRSSVTNKPRKVTGRCPLLLKHIRNRHQTTTVTTTSHQSRENDYFSGPTWNFGNEHENKARYCEINIRDACGEPVSPMSQRTGHVSVTGFYGAVTLLASL